jgi:cytochrome c5
VAKAMMTAWAAAGGSLGANAEHYADLKLQVLASQCMTCHSKGLSGGARNGAPADVNWDSYADATGFRTSGTPPYDQISKRGNTRVQAGTMPPAGGLSAAQKQLFQKWIDSGWPE